MNGSERAAVLSRWSQPSSTSERERQERALRMVKAAVGRWTAFDGVSHRIYAKGSYANNTNVRADSDVDVVVQNQECEYYEYFQCDSPSTTVAQYEGPWTPVKWRAELTKALQDAFGVEVDASGRVAINVAERAGTRVTIDVVPAFDFVRYDSSDRRIAHHGSRVFPRSGNKITNWPQQQYDNGVQKNNATGRRYKLVARTLKSAENQLAVDSAIGELASYFMECLAWNVPNHVLTSGFTLAEGFRQTLIWLYDRLGESYTREDWDEPNRLKYLFFPGSPWTPEDGLALVGATWNYLDY